MTVGKKVSALFPGVINCMKTDDLELKKLVIMAVNTFFKDCENPNPRIRALAVRSMGLYQGGQGHGIPTFQ